MKKILSLCLIFATVLALTACGKKDEKPDAGTVKTGSVYFLNFKPEVADIYKEIAAEYKKETGVDVRVVTAASNTYETTLKSEIAKNNAPTIFQINGPVGYKAWADYCEDLSDTKLYSYLSDKDLAVKNDKGVFGIPYVVEGYGIIYNNAIMEKYFALKDKAVSISKATDIKDFETLKTVVEDMTKHKKQLGIDGVFASTSMGSGEQWRWTNHLASVPIYYEMKKASDDSTIVSTLGQNEIGFTHSKNFKNIFDLYLNNSTTPKGLLSGKSVDNAMAEFALGKAAMVQNGNWAWEQIAKVGGNAVKAEDIRFMPIYTGVEGEEKQGLCIGTENYLAINKNASAEDKKASIAFLEWLFSSEKGKDFIVNRLKFISPFNTFKDDEMPEDPLAREILSWMKKDVNNLEWTFNSFPSQQFRDDVGNALLEYVQGSRDWSHIEQTFRTSWKNERNAK